jgi:hypothetical protein
MTVRATPFSAITAAETRPNDTIRSAHTKQFDLITML